MVQMVGVTVLALGRPQVFHSNDAGHTIDNTVAVAGYVVMRLSMIFLWLRAARQRSASTSGLPHLCGHHQRRASRVDRAAARTHTTVAAFFAWGVLLILIEMAGPVIAERGKDGTPWHAHHIAERYGLLTIITLGEGVIGTVASFGRGSRVIGLEHRRRTSRGSRNRIDLRAVVDALHGA